MQELVNWTVWSRKFDVSGAIVEPCHPASRYLCIMDTTRTPETQTSQGELLQLIDELAADSPLFYSLEVPYLVLSAHLSVIEKEG